MRPALVEIETIDNYLLHKMDAEEKILFEAKILLNDQLCDAVAAQRKTHKLLQLFWRGKQRKKLESIYHSLLRQETFSNSLKKIFDLYDYTYSCRQCYQRRL